jgi:preprotein translocase subunit SecA
MPDVGALLAGRHEAVGDGLYLERTPARELALEEHLRALLARLPRLGAGRGRRRRLLEVAAAQEAQLAALGDAGLKEAFRAYCQAMRREGFAPQRVACAFAAVREAARRTLGMRHYDVQLLGGWTLLQGRIAEMETGEGKTLVATLAAAVAAASGAAVHVVTVNDYLAGRDAAQNEPLYRFLGLGVGVIEQEMRPQDRRAQYLRDIVYVSNKELVFDYLKDRIAAGETLDAQMRLRRLYRPGRPPGLLLRGLHMAIVDEADSVLIDEARTPLIISEDRPDPLGGELYHAAIGIARRMQAGQHFELTRNHGIWLRPEADEALRQLSAGLGGVWNAPVWRRELLQKGLTALHSFHRDQHYIVAEGKVQIVDEFTGRIMPDRSWEQGLHQMVEAKESCEITGERKTLSRITYQRFFRRYLLLAGMTGTASEVAPELRRVYDLDVVRIPTHRPGRRQHLGSRCWRGSDERWTAVADRAAELSRQGRPVLVGTRSVEASERLSNLLTERQVQHTVLNARQDQHEAEAVAQAGLPGRITVATNMAGRGTDIRPAAEVLENGGLHVILTEFHESPRIDRQLYGRCARQGEPGTVEAMVSLEDELFVRFAPGLRRFTDWSGTERSFPKALALASQTAAERHNRRIRLETLQQDRKTQEMLGFAGKER